MSAISLIAVSSLALLGSQSTKITLQEAIQLAEAHSTSLRIAQDAVNTAKARLGEQGSRSLPHLAFAGSASRYDDKTTVNFPGVGSVELLPDHQEQLGLVLAQDLDVSGGIGASISQAHLLLLSSRYAAEAASQDQDLTTTEAYYNVLHAQEAVQVASSSLDAYREQLRTTTKLYQGGTGQKIDVDRSESQVADAERELTTRQNDLDSARSTLNDLVGQPLDQPLSLAPIGAAPADATDTPRPALIAKALNRRPEALEASMEVAAAKKGIQIARGANGPSAAISLSGYHYPTTSFQSPRENAGALTFTVSIPIFDGGLGREQVNEARSLVDTANAQQDQTRRQIALQVQNASLDVETARKRLDAAVVGAASAEQARKLAEQRYGAQVGLYLEVTDAQAALTAAQSAVNDATYDLLTAEARLDHAVSEPIVH